MILNTLVNQILTRICLWWLRDLMAAQRTAAIINQNTLKAGRSGLLTEGDALKTVEASLEKQILAIEAIMGMSEDS